MKKTISLVLCLAIISLLFVSCGTGKKENVDTTEEFDAKEAFKDTVKAYSMSYLLFSYDSIDYVDWWPTESPVISVNGNRYTCRGRLYIKAFGATFTATVDAVYTFDESNKSFRQVSVNISEPRSTGK